MWNCLKTPTNESIFKHLPPLKKKITGHCSMVVQRKNCGKHQHNAIGKLIRDLNLTQADHLWRRKWQPTTVFLPGESHGPEDPGGLQSIASQRVGHN